MAHRIRKQTAQLIVETVKEVCGQDVNFISNKGIILASTDLSRVGDYHEIGMQVIKNGQPLEVTAHDQYLGTQQGVNLPVDYQGEVIAVIGITGDPSVVRKYAHLALRITSLLLREQDFDTQLSNEKSRLNYIIRSLIDGETLRFDVFQSFITQFNIDSEASYRCIIVRLNDRYNLSNISMIENRIQYTFEKFESRLFTFRYPNEFILIAEESAFLENEALLDELAEKHKDILVIGIGSVMALPHQDVSYQAARLAIKSLQTDHNIAHFDNLYLELLLAAIPEDVRSRFLKKASGTLTDKDKTLLRMYFEKDMSLKQASDALFIHKNTLQYQLDRIHRETGFNPRSFKDAVLLYLTLRLENEFQN